VLCFKLRNLKESIFKLSFEWLVLNKSSAEFLLFKIEFGDCWANENTVKKRKSIAMEFFMRLIFVLKIINIQWFCLISTQYQQYFKVVLQSISGI